MSTSSRNGTPSTKRKTSTSNWISSWWKPKEEPKQFAMNNFGESNEYDGPALEDGEDIHLPVFTTQVAQSYAFGATYSTDDFNLTDGDHQPSSLECVPTGEQADSLTCSFSSYSMCNSTSMTPLLPLEPSRPSKVTKKKNFPMPDELHEDSITTIETEETELAYQTPCFTSDSLIGLLPERPHPRLRHFSTDTFYKRNPDKGTNQSASETSSATSSSSWYSNIPTSFRASAGNFFNKLQQWRVQKSELDVEAADRKITREELLRLFILKLEEESNYFDSSPSPDEELCECSKCQDYYEQYYRSYLKEYQQYGSQFSVVDPDSLEMVIMMSDLMNNGMTKSCTIM